jgi:DNA replication protein DnaC
MEKTITQAMQDLPFLPNLKGVSDPITYDNVELTDEELKQVVREAKIKKANELEYKRKQELRSNMVLFYSAPWKTEIFADFIKSKMISSGFNLDASNRNYVNALTFYFNRDNRFEDIELNNLGLKMDLNKGLFLFGTVGVGKTKIMELFYKNKRTCYKMISCRKVVSEYIKHGHDVIEPMSHSMVPMVKNIDNFFQDREGICFDDLGTESETANNFGNKRNVFEQILLDRYDNGLPFHETHITSNLSPEMIKERYGERVVSRMREMFNIIELKGNDRRK